MKAMEHADGNGSNAGYAGMGAEKGKEDDTSVLLAAIGSLPDRPEAMHEYGKVETETSGCFETEDRLMDEVIGRFLRHLDTKAGSAHANSGYVWNRENAPSCLQCHQKDVYCSEANETDHE